MEDIEFFNELMGYNMNLFGVGDEDMAVVTSNYSYVPAGLWYQGALESIGCATIPVGVGDTKRLIKTLAELPVTVLNTFTTYAVKLAEEAREMGLDPASSFSVNKLLISGEPGGGLPSVRKRLRELYGDSVLIRESYGTAENCRIALECSAEDGFHILEPYQYVEVVDKDTNEPVPPGKPGVLVCTTLGRKGWPVIRFRTEDICVMYEGDCSCGWPFSRISKLLGKANDIYRVKGILIYPETVAEVAGRFEQLGLFQMEITTGEKMMDQLLIKVEAPEELESRIREEFTVSLKTVLTISPKIEWLPLGSLPPEVKFKRIVDKRQMYSKL
jgi:phenylacetate-CoA ligase